MEYYFELLGGIIIIIMVNSYAHTHILGLLHDWPSCIHYERYDDDVDVDVDVDVGDQHLNLHLHNHHHHQKRKWIKWNQVKFSSLNTKL